MVKNKLWLWSNICATFSLISLWTFLLSPYILPKIVPLFKDEKAVLAGNIVMVIGALIVLCGLVMGWISYATAHKKLCLISNVVCNVGEIMSLGFFLMFIPAIVLGYVAYEKMRKEK